MQTAFYNLLIGRIQGRVPEKFHIMGGNGTEYAFAFSAYEDALKVALAGIAGIRNGAEVPTPTYGSSAYPWKAFGNKRAVEAGDVSIIGNMRRCDLDALRRNGIRTIRDMLSLRISDIISKCGIGSNAARNYWQSAASLVIEWPIRRARAKAQLPKRRMEIFLDMCARRANGDDTGNGFAVYMAGALVRNGRDERYVSFIADSTGEGNVVDGILGLVESAKDYAVYHCNVRNCELLIKDMERHRADAGTIRSITSGGRMFNLQGRAVALYALPVPGNDIGSIASYVGFRRTSPEIDPNWLCPPIQRILQGCRRQLQNSRAYAGEQHGQLHGDGCREGLAGRGHRGKRLPACPKPRIKFVRDLQDGRGLFSLAFSRRSSRSRSRSTRWALGRPRS